MMALAMPSRPGSPNWPTAITALIQEIPSPVAFPRPREQLWKICLQMPRDKTEERACPHVSVIQRRRSETSSHPHLTAPRSGLALAASPTPARADRPLAPAAPAPHNTRPLPGTPEAGPAPRERGLSHVPPAIPPNPAKKVLGVEVQGLAGAPVTSATATAGTASGSTSPAPARRSRTGTASGSGGAAPIPP